MRNKKKALIGLSIFTVLVLSTQNHFVLFKDDILVDTVIETEEKPDPNAHARAIYNPEQYLYEGSEVNHIRDQASLFVMVNKRNKLSEDYIPDAMVEPAVPFSFSGSDSKKLMRPEAAAALEALFAAATRENLSLYAVSGYRSYERQAQVFRIETEKLGLEEALHTSALPGHSEHQTGLAIDVSTSSVNYELEAVFATTPESDWLLENAHQYGFVIRYPQDKVDITGYLYEPWHLRYLGIDLSTYLYTEQLTLEEYFKSLVSQ